MKTLNKPEFLKFLQTISKILDDEEIKHEIPFCHINKIEFNYINIIIPDYLEIFDIVKILNTSEIKEKTGIIYSVIDDFDIRFIKTSEKLWIYTLYYYSWDILHILVNILALNFNLNYTRVGLNYIYNNKIIKLSKNLKDIFDFFELPFHMITTGFPTDYIIFEFIESSEFFNSENFTLEKFKELDYYYENNKKYYQKFIEHMPENKSNSITIQDQLTFIDICFKDAKFLEKLSKIKLKENYPNLKDVKKEFINDQKTSKNLINDLLEKKKKNIKQSKKINLNNIYKNKDDDLTFNIE